MRFRTADSAADTRERVIDLHRERVIVRRAVAGMRMAVSLPVTSFLGVALRVLEPISDDDGSVAIVLEHRDPALSVPLFVAPDGSDAVAEWQLWARVLGLRLLIADTDGTLRAPFAHLGALRVWEAQSRRRRVGPMKRRRASILMRRKPGRLPPAPQVFRDEREIIARS
ncbi:hypothetical protein A33M_3446 [Rhodovulum sp. PH10]|nr:hypothetical protein A33M_3446 [Rhodovulum sp. PH10]